jgi:hypothetical protein
MPCISELVLFGLRSTDWLPLFGFSPLLAALFWISYPPDPLNQGPVVVFGNAAPEFALTRPDAVPSDGSSNPQSPTRLVPTVGLLQFG